MNLTVPQPIKACAACTDNSAMSGQTLWDIFCTVIDNHGDLGVCWRLARQLRDAGQIVRLWVDDTSALHWMAPGLLRGAEPGITLYPWARASQAQALQDLPMARVWVEAFGCTLPEAFVAHGCARAHKPPVWINLEYLSAEPAIHRLHTLPSPVMHGPARGWHKTFFYPGFTPQTGGLLREQGLHARWQAFGNSGARQAWRLAHAPELARDGVLCSLFCYEPAALPDLLAQLSQAGHRLLVTPGRALAALQQTGMAAVTQQAPTPASMRSGGPLPAALQGDFALSWQALPYTDQDRFDHMLWACDLNLVRGEDSLVRALWAGQALVWQIYPQDDGAHHIKLEAFLDWLHAPADLRAFHRIWNGLERGPLPRLNPTRLADWRACIQQARERLLAQDDLCTQLLAWVQRAT